MSAFNLILNESSDAVCSQLVGNKGHENKQVESCPNLIFLDLASGVIILEKGKNILK